MMIRFKFAGVVFAFECQESFRVTGRLKSFLTDETQDDVVIRVRKCMESSDIRYPLCREDDFRSYYGDGSTFQIRLRGARGSAVGMLTGKDDMDCWDYELYQFWGDAGEVLDSWVKLFPVKVVLSHFRAFLFHAAQIELDGKAVLFLGPSGTGKSTQAELWGQFRQTPRRSNDRTILRCIDGTWHAFGFYEDGSRPVAQNTNLPLAALVLLGQSAQNRITALQGRGAVRGLTAQMFVEAWDQEMRNRVLDGAAELAGKIPVYSFVCRPDESAVEYLETRLRRDGVIR